METYSAMREDRQMLMIMHLSQLLDFVTGIGGFIVPLILWATQKDKIQDMEKIIRTQDTSIKLLEEKIKLLESSISKLMQR